MKQHY